MRFVVADNGIGIAPEYAERIFGLFRRLQGVRRASTAAAPRSPSPGEQTPDPIRRGLPCAGSRAAPLFPPLDRRRTGH
jgi:hypothetical protein